MRDEIFAAALALASCGWAPAGERTGVARGPAFEGGAVIYVDGSADDGGDGKSWRTAIRFLQDALTVAGDEGSAAAEIRIAQGVYTPDRSSLHPSGTGDRSASFVLVDGVTLRGGYAGLAGADPDERDIEAFVTVLSGDLAGNDGPDFAGNDENSLTVVTIEYCRIGVVVDGVTIVGGNFNGSDSGYTAGGGMRIVESSAHIETCTFAANSAVYGGGLAVEGGDAIYIQSCTFNGNRASRDGGGIRAWGNVTIEESTFISNTAADYGGAVVNDDRCLIVRCDFRSNSANSGGGVASMHGGIVEVYECHFEDNHALSRGGALIYKLLSGYLGAVIYRGTFKNNTANIGGALCLASYGDAMVIDSEFTGNTAAQNGGAIDGLFRQLMIHGCNFLGNEAIAGGAARVRVLPFDSNQALIVVQSSFAGNSAVVQGGAIESSVYRCSIEASEFYSNSAPLGGAFYGPATSHPTKIRIDQCQFAHGSASRGGALLVEDADELTISDSVLSFNDAVHGGALHTSALGTDVSGSTFISNSADIATGQGGAIVADYGTIHVSDGQFINNSGSLGGALAVVDGAEAMVTSTDFQHNHAWRGGAVAGLADTVLTVRSSDFVNNGCVFSGAAAYSEQGAMRLENCLVAANAGSPPMPWGQTIGGAVTCIDGTLLLDRCRVRDNHAMYYGAIVLMKSDSTLVSSVVQGNDGTSGGGIRIQSGQHDIINCTIAHNESQLSYPSGIRTSSMGQIPARVTNCIIWGNTHPQMTSGSSSIQCSYSNVEGGFTGVGNINLDPLFADDDLRLQAASPCIDAGSNDPLLDQFPLDLDGNARIVDGLGDGVALADMGAYERQVMPGVIDGLLTRDDLLAALAAWGSESSGASLDAAQFLVLLDRLQSSP